MWTTLPPTGQTNRPHHVNMMLESQKAELLQTSESAPLPFSVKQVHKVFIPHPTTITTQMTWLQTNYQVLDMHLVATSH